MSKLQVVLSRVTSSQGLFLQEAPQAFDCKTRLNLDHGSALKLRYREHFTGTVPDDREPAQKRLLCSLSRAAPTAPPRIAGSEH